MATATHAFCPRCNQFEPMIWTNVIIAEVHVDGRIGRFEGLELKCRVCQFEITKVGVVSKGSIIGAAEGE